MPYIRVSLIRAREPEAARVNDLLDDLVAFYAGQPGYITGYRLEPTEPQGYVGRIGVWDSEADADKAAQQDHDLALRSQLNAAVEEHREYSFTGYEPKPA